ncbi:MAG: AAA family ATPase [Deltaproteobacteria bacterium]|nr:AAA family ATPase [Deltaproteobacteria bacterium]
MAFSLNIENFGKLANATINIGNLTILAGPNNTGKSYVSKLLYSLVDAMNADHFSLHLSGLIAPIGAGLSNLRIMIDDSDEQLYFHGYHSDLSILNRHLRKMRKIAESRPVDGTDYEEDLSAIREAYSLIRHTAREMRQDYSRVKPAIAQDPKHTLENLQERSASNLRYVVEILSRIETNIENLCNMTESTDAYSFVIGGIRRKIRQNLTRNFQELRLSALIQKGMETSKINIEGRGELQIQKNSIQPQITPAELLMWQQYSGAIYLESPLYWKLQNVTRRRRLPFFRSGRSRMGDFPGYFYDLLYNINEEFHGEIDFPGILENLIDNIGGKLILSEDGDLLFLENDHKFTMPLAATGVINLGILALSIERKVLNKGTFLFIDEPEAHLHPAWQVVMAETLFELAQKGVNVVIATHSADILKWIEEWVKANPGDQKFIALNQFSANGVVAEDDDFETRLANIKGELTKPFADLYLGGLPKR